MKHKNYFTYLILATLLTGCLKVQSKNEAAPTKSQPKAKPSVVQPQADINRELRLEDVFVENVGQNKPNIYDVVFTWPQTKDRVRLSSNNQVLTIIDTKTTQQWMMSNLQGGKSVALLIEILDEKSHIISSETRQIEIPKDYVFSKFLRLTSHMKIQSHRVFMNESVIMTENFNLEIHAQQLVILKKSSIYNYLPETKAKPGTEGRSGGSVYINADTAVGDLDITMNSESGGNGIKGHQSAECPTNAALGCYLTQVHCAQGGHGYPAGQNGHLTVKVKDVKDFNLYAQEQFSLGGVKGPSMGENTPADYPIMTSHFRDSTCVIGDVQPNGADAAPGRMCLMLSDSISQAGCE